MRLVTFQPLGSSALKTGILIGKDQVIDIVADANARGATQKVATMLDIIAGGDSLRGTARVGVSNNINHLIFADQNTGLEVAATEGLKGDKAHGFLRV